MRNNDSRLKYKDPALELTVYRKFIQAGKGICTGTIVRLCSVKQLMFLLFMIAFGMDSDLYAQAKTEKASAPLQQIRGTVVDEVLQTPVAGATVRIERINRSVITDNEGGFRFSDVPLGVYQLNVSHVSIKEIILDNITLNAGKEVVLTIKAESKVQTGETVVVKATSRKNKPLNEMSAVSARAFTVEETQKYAAAVNDPSRMATGFPGVMSADDGNNTIIIRGNSPTGMLWRMEGIDIPNPNHFSSTGSSGGGISILSAQLLSNSDFITGAFASEYGNALSGVFDLKLRKGNNEKREYTLQAGFLGLNVAAEGPFKKGYKGSYLVNYRYSTLSLLDKMGVPIQSGATNFQDISYNIYLPTSKYGNFTLFGFGGRSSEDVKPNYDSTKWDEKWDRYTSKFVSNTKFNGFTHQTLIGSKTNLRSAIGFSDNKIIDNFRYIQDDLSLRDEYIDHFRTKKWTASSTMNHKFSPKSTLRAGAIFTHISLDYYQKSKENDSADLKEVINTIGDTRTIQGFGQWQFKPFENLTLNAGLHFLHLAYNSSQALEPRASLKWQVNQKNSLAFGFGQHSQIQGLGVYFAQQTDADGKLYYPNKDLDLTKAKHYVLSFQHQFHKTLALKAEAYYQSLSNVPVSIYDTSTFSTLNIQSEYVTDPLVNKGKGRNYGLELSLEKYLDRHFYYTISSSLYESKYTAADNVERNTRFNGNYIFSLVTGKEFVSTNQRRTFGVNIKTIYAGGLRTTPLDFEQSKAHGYAIYKEKEAYTQQNPAYFRSDLRLSMKWNKKKLTSTLSLDVQNLTNRLNVFGQWYDADKIEIKTAYQNGLIPVLNYKIEF